MNTRAFLAAFIYGIARFKFWATNKNLTKKAHWSYSDRRLYRIQDGKCVLIEWPNPNNSQSKIKTYEQYVKENKDNFVSFEREFFIPMTEEQKAELAAFKHENA